jgi:hypothetical protein
MCFCEMLKEGKGRGEIEREERVRCEQVTLSAICFIIIIIIIIIIKIWGAVCQAVVHCIALVLISSNCA